MECISFSKDPNLNLIVHGVIVESLQFEYLWVSNPIFFYIFFYSLQVISVFIFT